MSRLVRGSVFLLLASLASQSWSLEVTFERIGDQSTRVPGQPPWETFQSFGICAVDEGHVVSRGSWGSFGSGVYTWHGGSWSLVVDRGAPVPDLPGTLITSIEFRPSVDRGEVAFNAIVSMGDDEAAIGAFSNVGGSLRTLVLNEETAIPATRGELFTYVFPPRTDDGVVFLTGGAHPGTKGVYRWEGDSLEVVADTTTAIPGDAGALFTGFQDAMTGDGVVAFFGGRPLHTGIYRARPGRGLEVVVDTTTEAPGHPGVTLEALVGLDTYYSVGEDGRVAFAASRSDGGYGVYADAPFGNGELMTIADTETPTPDGSAVFTGFNDVALSHERVAFVGYEGNARGLYVWEPDGVITRIIGKGDELDGQLVDWVFVGAEAVSGDELVFLALFETGAQALYLAHLGPPDPPEPGLLEVPATSPAGLALLALTLAVFGIARRRFRGGGASE